MRKRKRSSFRFMNFCFGFFFQRKLKPKMHFWDVLSLSRVLDLRPVLRSTSVQMARKTVEQKNDVYGRTFRET